MESQFFERPILNSLYNHPAHHWELGESGQPNTGEVRSDGADGVACWFIDTDYNEEAWAPLDSDTSHSFGKPGRIVVKVINHSATKL